MEKIASKPKKKPTEKQVKTLEDKINDSIGLDTSKKEDSKQEQIAKKSQYYFLYEDGYITQQQCMFLAFFENNLGNVAHALRSANVKSRQTFYNWVADNKEFAEVVKDIKESQIDFVESKLQENIHKGNLIAQMFYLKTIGRGRGYIEKMEIDNKIEVVDFEFEEVK